MPTTLGSVRRLLMTPSLLDVTFSQRGFPVQSSAATRRLEAIPQAVICGFEWGIDTRSQWELERRLALVEPEHAGFAYEGATMACTILDAMRPRQGRRTADLLDGSGERHIFLAYIGVGFAMARLPRALWPKVLPELKATAYHPVMSWLAVDGYGFDRAYFDPKRWVDKQKRPQPYAWQRDPDYFLRAFDQGVGRALWFIHGADPDAVAAAVRRFSVRREADLWSGIGLAATFAGGCATEGLRRLREAAGVHRAELALGTIFAAKARAHAGRVPVHTEQATAVLADLTVAAADKMADDTTVASATTTGPMPRYEHWRENIRQRIATQLANPVG